MDIKRLMFLKAMGSESYTEATNEGNPAVFTTDVAKPLVNLRVPLSVKQGGSGTPSLDNIRTITPYTGIEVSVNSSAVEMAFGNSVCVGTVDLITGKLYKSGELLTLNTKTMNNSDGYPGWKNSGIEAIIGHGINTSYNNQIMNIGTKFYANTNYNDLLFFVATEIGKTETELKALEQDVQIYVPYSEPVLVTTLTPVEVSTIVGENTISAEVSGNLYIKYLVKA